MHFCKFNLEFLGLGYKPSKEIGWVFSIQTFELYRCRKCNKSIFVNLNTHNCGYKDTLDEYIELIERCGYKPIGELLKDKEEK